MASNDTPITIPESHRLDRYIFKNSDDLFVAEFPEPNGVIAVWDGHGDGGIHIYEDYAKATEATDYVAAVEAEPRGMMRPFALRRYEDVTGCSGDGVPAVGVEFPDGRCVMGWLTENNSVAVYDTIRDVQNIHGHGGSTRVFYTDTEDA